MKGWLVVAVDDQGQVVGFWDGGEDWVSVDGAAVYQSKRTAQRVAESFGAIKDVDVIVGKASKYL